MKNRKKNVIPFHFGLTLVTPMMLFIFLAIWLQEKFGLGYWVVVVGIVLGVISIVYQFFVVYSKEKKTKTDSKRSINYNQHE